MRLSVYMKCEKTCGSIKQGKRIQGINYLPSCHYTPLPEVQKSLSEQFLFMRFGL